MTQKLHCTLIASLVTLNLLFSYGISFSSNCYDHWNGDAWHGSDLMAMVLCLDSAKMNECEVRRHLGGKIADLEQHGGLDRGRVIWTNYSLHSSSNAGILDIVCTAIDGLTYTYTIENIPGVWWDWGGCAENTDYGGAACINDQDQHILSLSKSDPSQGTVSISPLPVKGAAKCGLTCGSLQSYMDPDIMVSLEAIPAAGHIFVGWSGDACEGSKQTCTTVMTSAKSIAAIFVPINMAPSHLLLREK